MTFAILGCPHNHLSFPIVTHEPNPPLPPAGQPPHPQAHVTCLDCGREFWYDWSRMRRLAARVPNAAPPRRAA
ncbi:MAG: hypothetical protein ACRD1Y_02800 [Terriglobales bacterium]